MCSFIETVFIITVIWLFVSLCIVRATDSVITKYLVFCSCVIPWGWGREGEEREIGEREREEKESERRERGGERGGERGEREGGRVRK
jgi:hypothetical protein